MYLGMLIMQQTSRQRELARDLPFLERDTFYLDVLVTIPAARGKGVAGSLLKDVSGKARTDGERVTLLTVTEANVNSAKLRSLIHRDDSTAIRASERSGSGKPSIRTARQSRTSSCSTPSAQYVLIKRRNFRRTGR